MSVTDGCPFVRVPVLSKTIVLILPASSNWSPPLIRMPFSAPFPVPTSKAAGVAIPSAQGQARSEEHTSELQSQSNLVCRLLLEKTNNLVHQLLRRLDAWLPVAAAPAAAERPGSRPQPRDTFPHTSHPLVERARLLRPAPRPGAC